MRSLNVAIEVVCGMYAGQISKLVGKAHVSIKVMLNRQAITSIHERACSTENWGISSVNILYYTHRHATLTGGLPYLSLDFDSTT